MFKQLAYVLAAALSAMFVGACSADSDAPVLPGADGDEPGYVNLYISVAANNPVAPGIARSRTMEGDTNFFQDGIPPYENINSLRIIMVDSGKIEYNEYIKGPAGTSTDLVESTVLRTHQGGTRRIYLIANEAAAGLIAPAVLPQLSVGKELPKELVQYTIPTVPAAPGSPLYSDGKTYLPMSEIFDVKIDSIPATWDASDENPYVQHANLFVTRAAVKFSFIIQTYLDGLKDTDKYGKRYRLGQDFRISNIAINSVGNTEYLFPTNTTYYPAKALNTLNREIIAYDVPADAQNATANISIPESAYSDKSRYTQVTEKAYGILVPGDSIFTYAPPIYFPETKILGENAYTMDVTIDWLDGSNESETIEKIPLPNMPNGGLPRNTHVLVILTPGIYDLKASVRLVPYIGVELNPSFGFDQLRPGANKNPDNK